MNRLIALFWKLKRASFIEDNNSRSCNDAFTLAEMLVVMLILTIVMAAFAPLMTKRKVVDNTTPWRYATNNSDIYYGLATNQTAMIGKNGKLSSDINSKLLINRLNNTQAHIAFSSSGTKLGQLQLGNNAVLLGGPTNEVPNLASLSVTGIGARVFGAGTNSGASNIAVGDYVMYNNSSGSNNTAIGSSSMRVNTVGNYNTAVGAGALYNNLDAHDNVAVGMASLNKNTQGSGNAALGSYSLYANTTGESNTAVGTYSLFNSNTGDYNTAIGYNACKNISGSSNNYVTCVGADSGPDSGKSVSNVIYLGRSTDKIYIPGSVIIEGTLDVNNTMHVGARDSLWDLKMRLGDNTTAVTISGTGPGEVKHQRDWQAITDYRGTYSDKRLKNVGDLNKSGLEKIRQVNVYDFTFKNDKDKKPQVGVIAQDLQKVFPDAVMKDSQGYLKIRWDDMFYAIINSIKELDKTVQQLVEDVKTAIERLNSHDEEIKKLQQENEELKERIEKLEKLVK